MQRGALNHAHVHGQGCSRHALPPCSLPPAAYCHCLLRPSLLPGEQQQQQQLFGILKRTQNPSDGNDGSKTISFCSLVASWVREGEGCERGEGAGGRGIHWRYVELQLWSLTSLRCKCVHNAANSGSANKSAQKRSGNSAAEKAAPPPSSPPPFCLLFIASTIYTLKNCSSLLKPTKETNKKTT